MELIELIENYLMGKLNTNDKNAFEERMNSSEQLTEEVALQRTLMEGFELSVVRASTQQAYKRYRISKNGWKFGLGGASIVALIVAGIMYLAPVGDEMAQSQDNAQNIYIPNIEEVGEAYELIPSQNFTIDPSEENVIGSQYGILFGIPENAFVDENGDPVEGNVELELKEAMDPATIMRSGHSTMSGKDLLETGGMFYLGATQNGKPVQLDPEKLIQTLVPTDERDPNMQLWDGEVADDGSIDWVDPKPLENFLLPVNILDLDFYPPGYENKVAELGLDVTDKSFKDSLYYSFAYQIDVEPSAIQEMDEEADPLWLGDTMPSSEVFTENDSTEDGVRRRGIDPIKIKSIWNNDFQNTLLATKEFEERLPLIFATCDNSVLDLYVNNLDKPISVLDAQVVEMGHSEFQRFADRGEGRVAVSEALLPKLRKAYYEKQKTNSTAIIEAQKRYWDDQRDLDIVASKKRQDHYIGSMEQRANILNEEIESNKNHILNELGITMADVNNEHRFANHYWVHITAYVARIQVNSWKNIDLALAMNAVATAQGRDLTIQDDRTGRTAKIRYNDLEVHVTDGKSFDRVFAYLLPSDLNSYQRMDGQKTPFHDRLNERFEYDLIVIGYREAEFFFAKSENVQFHNELTLTLENVSENELERHLSMVKNSSTRSDLFEDVAWYKFDQIDKIRRVKNIEKGKIKDAVRPVVLPCSRDLTVQFISEEEYSFE